VVRIVPAALCILAVLLARPIPFEQSGLWGYRTPAGKPVIEPRFEVALPFSPEGIAAVVDREGWAYIDRTGAILIRPYVFDNGPDYFQEGLARFTAAGKIGFFDKRGRVAIPARFAFALPFSEGRAAVCEDCREVSPAEHRAVEGGRWGFIDRAGALVIPIQFDEGQSFAHGKARVRTAGQWKFIDRSGK
jgi:hypothetical protein